jgi:hypothetical protein
MEAGGAELRDLWKNPTRNSGLELGGLEDHWLGVTLLR